MAFLRSKRGLIRSKEHQKTNEVYWLNSYQILRRKGFFGILFRFMSDTQIIDGVPIEVPIRMTADEIFDAIMGDIEPELTSAQIGTLKEKYKDETEAEKKMRGERYIKAYAEFDKRYAEVHAKLQGKARSFHLEAMRSVESKDKKEEAANLESIESSLTSL